MAQMKRVKDFNTSELMTMRAVRCWLIGDRITPKILSIGQTVQVEGKETIF